MTAPQSSLNRIRQIREEQRRLKGDGKSGVLVLPAILPNDEWEKLAEAQQKRLMEGAKEDGGDAAERAAPVNADRPWWDKK